MLNFNLCLNCAMISNTNSNMNALLTYTNTPKSTLVVTWTLFYNALHSKQFLPYRESCFQPICCCVFGWKRNMFTIIHISATKYACVYENPCTYVVYVIDTNCKFNFVLICDLLNHFWCFKHQLKALIFIFKPILISIQLIDDMDIHIQFL